MAFDVDTLFVISSGRGEYFLSDLVSAIYWACPRGSAYVVAVDTTGSVETLTAAGKYQLLHSDIKGEVASGFQRAAGLKWAIDQEIGYKQVIFLDDTCLIMGQPLDEFLVGHMGKQGVGVLGVRDTHGNYENAFRDSTTLMQGWEVPHQSFENPPVVLADAFLAISPALAGALYQTNLLVPDKADQWPTTYGAYIAWLSHMLGFHVVSWGSTDKTLPPFFVNYCHGPFLPAPTILSSRFLVFSDATKVLSYAEGDLRELFKKQRGEPCRDIQSFGPVVTGPGMD